MIQSNATLKAIENSGVASDWRDTPATPGAEKWTGRARAYYTEKRERVQSPTAGGDSDAVLRRTLIVPTDVGDELDENDVLVFEYRGVEQRATAKLIERRDLSDFEPGLRTTRIELADA